MRLHYQLPLFILLAFSLASCKTAYVTGPTPDDLYLASGRPNEDPAKKESEDDRFNRMRYRDRRWRELDDAYGFNHHYSPYYYGYQSAYYYNPFYSIYPVFHFDVKNNTPRTTNLSSYQSSQLQTITNIKTGETRQLSGTNKYNNSNRSGNIIRSVFDGNSPSKGDSRIYSPSSGGSSGNGGSSIGRPSRN